LTSTNPQEPINLTQKMDIWQGSQMVNEVGAAGVNQALSLDAVPYEVQAIILRYVVNGILNDLRTTTGRAYANKLCQWTKLRLVSKSIHSILSQMTFEGVSLDVLFRRKQLEKLEFALEAIHIVAVAPPVKIHLSVPKLKTLCGKFWHNPDLTADTIKKIASLISSPPILNFAAKLESWILRHCTRSSVSSTSRNGLLVFERGDWIVDAHNLRIRRVSRWVPTVPYTRMVEYLAYETEGSTPVHQRLGNTRRWYIEYTGGSILRCLVNYGTKMIWDDEADRIYDFEGAQYMYEDRTDPVWEEEEDSDDETDSTA